MPYSVSRARFLVRAARWFAVASVTLLLVATAALVVLERRWVPPAAQRDPRGSFFDGPIGTELAPLVVLQVLPDMFPEHFQPAKDGGDWIDQFGFLRADPPAGDGLPMGFVTSNYRPASGAPSPVRFVGFSCVLCHSTRIRDEAGREHLVIGPGN